MMSRIATTSRIVIQVVESRLFRDSLLYAERMGPPPVR